MIKFSSADRSVYILGLSRGNIDQLTAGRPIKVNLADMGGPNIKIGIYFDETERGLFDQIKNAGLLPPGIEYVEATPDKTEVIRVLSPEDKEVIKEIEQSDGLFTNRIVDELWPKEDL